MRRKFDVHRDATWYLGKLTEELGEVHAAYLKSAGQGRCDKPAAAQRRDLEDETADLFGFLMVFASWQNIDLEAAFERKWGAYLPD